MKRTHYSFGGKAAITVVLALLAGSVDATSWLSLLRVYTAHMSGNTVSSGIYLSQHAWGKALHHAVPIPSFVIGVAWGTLMSEALIRRGIHSIFFPSLVCEGGLLILVVFGWSHGLLQREGTALYYFLVALPAIAMGLQNATIRYVGKLTVRTTYITGVLTGFTEALVSYLVWLGEQTNRPLSWKELGKQSRLKRSFVRAVLLGSVWLGYLSGAFLGAWIEGKLSEKAFLIPATGFFLLAALDFLRPFSTPKRIQQLSP